MPPGTFSPEAFSIVADKCGGVGIHRTLYPQHRKSERPREIDVKGHVWTAPAVQEESGFLRSVRVQPCIRPVFAWRLAPLRCSRYGRWP